MPPLNSVPEISIFELKQLRDQKKSHFLLDVREPDEFAHCRIEGSVLIPLGELPSRLDEIPKDREIIVHCHHGGRSARAVRLLTEKGFSRTKNLLGGIDAWSCEADPSVPRY